jgi:hypothetical protein
MKFTKTPIALAAITVLAGAPLVAEAVTVSFRAPSSGSVLSNVNWSQSSACEVSGTNIRNVQFYLINSSGNRIALNNDWYSAFRCNLKSTDYPNGNYTLRAFAYDSAGNQAISSRSITIKNTTTDAKPTISFSAPASNATVSGLTTCQVSARDDKSVKQVQFFMDGTLLSTDTTSSYTCSIDNKKYTNGAHTLKAVVTDSANQTASAQITINISGGISSTTGNTPPILSIDAPAAGSTLGGSVPFAATATDAGGSVAKVEMYLVSGTTQKLVAADTTSPYSGSFSTAGVPDGAAQLMAVATDNLGAKSTVQRSVTIKNGSTTPTDPAPTDPAPSAIAPSDIITRATADVPFSQQNGYTAQCINTYTSSTQIPESGIHGATLPDGETLRLGKTRDPANSLRNTLSFQVRNSDPTTSNGKRSELAITPNIEMNKVYWIAFSAYIHDWGTLATGDDALFGTQMHTGDNQAGVGGPSFGLNTTRNGRTFRVQARYSTSSTPTASNAISVKFAEYPIPFGRWTDFVLKFKHNTSGNGFLQVWMDGQMIADYKGSLGYNTGMKDYAKFGYYNWTASAMNSTPRKVLLREPTIVADPTGTKYSPEQLRAHVGSSATTSASTSTTTIGSTSGTTTSSGGVCSTALCVATQ